MTRWEWLRNLKPGDEVCFQRRKMNGESTGEYVVSKVSRVTPTGRIVLKGNERFRRTGEAYAIYYFAGPLEPVTPSVRESINRWDLLKRLSQASFEELPIGILEKMLELALANVGIGVEMESHSLVERKEMQATELYE